MSREIKFRCWDETIKDFHRVQLGGRVKNKPNSVAYVNPSKKPNGSFDGNLGWQQFTGLKDKNGKEIYEGDIVVYGSDRPLPIIFHEHGVFSFEGKDFALGIYDQRKMEVIGNIVENPELLK